MDEGSELKDQIDELANLDTTPPALAKSLKKHWAEPEPEANADDPADDPADGPVDAPVDTPVEGPVDTLLEVQSAKVLPVVSTPRYPEGPDGSTDGGGGLQAKVTSLEQNVRVLRGKYDKEVPGLQADVLSRDTEITRLRAENADLELAKPVDVRSWTDDELMADQGITQDQFEQGGREMWEGVAQATARSAASTRAQVGRDMDERFGAVQAQQDEQAAQTQDLAAERFYAEIEVLVPNMDAIANSAEFSTWMDDHPSFAVAYNAAGRSGDASGVADVISVFVSKHPDLNFGEPAAAAGPKVSIDSQVVPSTATGPGPVVETVPTQPELDAEHAAITIKLTSRRGKYTDAQKDVLYERLHELEAIGAG